MPKAYITNEIGSKKNYNFTVNKKLVFSYRLKNLHDLNTVVS